MLKEQDKNQKLLKVESDKNQNNICQKVVHPYAHRLVTLRDWKSRWFGDKITKTYFKEMLLSESF